jgi:tetratricopeptide (TPR) repeat protein
MKTAMSELIALFATEAAQPGFRTDPELWQRVVEVRASAEDFAQVWQAALAADSSRTWSSTKARALTLITLTRLFEHLREHNYPDLKTALGRMRTHSGRPLSVDGTRYEVSTRTAQALYTEGRHKPSEHAYNLMLSVSEAFFSMFIAETFRRNDCEHAKRWHGMRGVCRLMLAVQGKANAPELQQEQFANAATDLEKSFHLGNRGASAATFLLDALLHLYEIDQGEGTRERIDSTISCLRDDEKRNRGVLAILGKYRFWNSFRISDPIDELRRAIQLLDESLTFPTSFANDDAQVRFIRGQALVRLSMALKESDRAQSLLELTKAIDDLRHAYESSPQKYGVAVQLPSALIGRADMLRRARQNDQAIQDLRYVLDHEELRNADLALRSQAEFKLLLLTLLKEVDNHDWSNVESALEPVVEHPECPKQGALIVALAASKLFDRKSSSNDPTLLEKTIAVMEAVDYVGFPNGADRRKHLSHLARLLLLLGAKWRPEALAIAFEKYEEAISTCPDAPPIELLSQYGDCALKLARSMMSQDKERDEAIEVLENGAEALLRAATLAEQQPEEVHESFERAVAYSKAGEAFLRLSRVSSDAKDARNAIMCFERALALGNKTPHLLGLLGDAYYRCFRINGDDDLRQHASRYKGMAREAGAASRENLSLSARLAFLEWEVTGNHAEFLSAITLVAQAHENSPKWPWPPFQLVEFLTRTSPEDGNRMLADLPSSSLSLTMLRLAVEEGIESLVRLGCRLAIDDDEFGKNKLGGQQSSSRRTYVLEDPHGLLSASYVFKHTETLKAVAEQNATVEFSQFLREKGITGVRFPTQVAIVEQAEPGAVVYVMRRATGHHLGRLALGAQRSASSPPVSQYRKALRFLAAYHAWGESTRPTPSASLVSFVRSCLGRLFSNWANSLDVSTESLLQAVGTIAHVLNKDAHPENWLIDDRGNLTMIDFEVNETWPVIPAIMDVVQLIDGYPLFPATRDGWKARIDLAKSYLSAKDELSGTRSVIDEGLLDTEYATFAILRCAEGISRAARHKNRLGSSSTVRSREEKRLHCLNLLEFLRQHHVESGIRAMAELMRVMEGETSDGVKTCVHPA